MGSKDRAGEKGKRERKKKYIIKKSGVPPALALRPWMAPLGTNVAYLVPGHMVWAGHPGPARALLTGVHIPSAGAYLVLFTCPCSLHLRWHCGFLAHSLDTLPVFEVRAKHVPAEEDMNAFLSLPFQGNH